MSIHPTNNQIISFMKNPASNTNHYTLIHSMKGSSPIPIKSKCCFSQQKTDSDKFLTIDEQNKINQHFKSLKDPVLKPRIETPPNIKADVEITLLPKEKAKKIGILATGIIFALDNKPVKIGLISEENNTRVAVYEQDIAFEFQKGLDQNEDSNGQILLKNERLGFIQIAPEQSDIVIQRGDSLNSYTVHRNGIRLNDLSCDFSKTWAPFLLGNENTWKKELLVVKRIQKTTDEFNGVNTLLVKFFKQWMEKTNHSYFLVDQREGNTYDGNSLNQLAPQDKQVCIINEETTSDEDVFRTFDSHILVYAK